MLARKDYSIPTIVAPSQASALSTPTSHSVRKSEPFKSPDSGHLLSCSISQQASTTSTRLPSGPNSWPTTPPCTWWTRSPPFHLRGPTPWSSKAPPTSRPQSQWAPRKGHVPRSPPFSSSSISPHLTPQYLGALCSPRGRSFHHCGH